MSVLIERKKKNQHVTNKKEKHQQTSHHKLHCFINKERQIVTEIN